MKKLTIMLSILAFFGLTNAQFQGGLTNEVPNLRVIAMGNVYSLIETSNYADFPQRVLTGQEGAWIGTNRSNSWGLARFNLNNFIDLPVPMAWQVSAEQMSMTTISQLFDYVGLNGYYMPYQHVGMSYEATNRINSTFAFGIKDNLIAGLGLKMYSNSNSYDYSDDANDVNYEHSFWGLETTLGGTMVLDDSHFIDASIDLDFWSWDGEFKVNDDDNYEEGYSNCDGVMNFGLNARYYATGTKVDYAPYMKFNYLSFASSVDHEVAVDQFEKEENNGSVMNFILGSEVHYKPADGVKVYNEFEFRYQSRSQEINDDAATNKEEDYQTTITLLPTYRMGVELTKEIDPKTWWGFNSVQLWGGFNKTFYDVWGGEDWDDEETDNNDYEEETTSTFEDVSVTTGAALQNGNFKLEFCTNIQNLQFDDAALNSVSVGLTYMFNK